MFERHVSEKLILDCRLLEETVKSLKSRAQIVISYEKWWHMRNTCRNAVVRGKDSTKTKKQKQKPNHREWHK